MLVATLQHPPDWRWMCWHSCDGVPLPLLLVCCSRVLDQGQRLELLHKTQIEGIPGALAAFKGRLLAGVGPVLRLYELGKKKLLRKCEYKQLPQHVAQLQVLGSRIFVGDVQVSCRVCNLLSFRGRSIQLACCAPASDAFWSCVSSM